MTIMETNESEHMIVPNHKIFARFDNPGGKDQIYAVLSFFIDKMGDSFAYFLHPVSGVACVEQFPETFKGFMYETMSLDNIWPKP